VSLDPTQQQQGQHAHVAVCSTAAAADFVAATLSVNGVAAATHAYALVYPSIDWVEGYRVSVAPEAAEAARALLAELGRDDVAAIDG
jgi:hypothetical protein